MTTPMTAATPRKMPISIQDFRKLRTEGCVYVDKTEHLHRLITRRFQVFLSRPRRFGKSLFISTLKYYFLGRKELFDGLYIANVEKEWMEYPVFHIEFVGENYSAGIDRLRSALDSNLRSLEEEWGRDEQDDSFADRFKGLIKRASKKTGRGVVVLVDEYDKPLLETMHDEALNSEVRAELKGFYGVLTGLDACLKFVFLTGVTKFSQISIFSDLTHLDDISLLDDYSGLCGISERELLEQFKPEIQLLADRQGYSYDEAVAELKKEYDGYHFSKHCEDMYNPFSVINVLDKLDFSRYWFKTGTPTFLIKMLERNYFDLSKLNGNVSVTDDYMFDYRANNQDPIPVLYQSGYLTVKGYDNLYNEYQLGFPNEEVKYGFLDQLLSIYSYNSYPANGFSVAKISQSLQKGDIKTVMLMLQSFFADIPYDLQDKRHKNEKYFQSLFYTVFTLMGQFIQAEVKSAGGRSDAVVKTSDSIYVFEFKIDDNATVEDALQQIDSKDYLLPYQTDGRRLIKIGAVFNKEESKLTDYKIV
ncbi:MAG: ATP-binding protein [Tannerella sp.]|jgi:hypothetical protein|nr:ATP-binding protein [Tannerella sp.]